MQLAKIELSHLQYTKARLLHDLLHLEQKRLVLITEINHEFDNIQYTVCREVYNSEKRSSAYAYPGVAVACKNSERFQKIKAKLHANNANRKRAIASVHACKVAIKTILDELSKANNKLA